MHRPFMPDLYDVAALLPRQLDADRTGPRAAATRVDLNRRGFTDNALWWRTGKARLQHPRCTGSGFWRVTG
jgi:hypothetical protein